MCAAIYSALANYSSTVYKFGYFNAT